jgi:hypothetical protein
MIVEAASHASWFFHAGQSDLKTGAITEVPVRRGAGVDLALSHAVKRKRLFSF